MFGLNFQMIAAAVVAAFLLAGAAAWKGYSMGKSEGVIASLKAERNQLEERNKTDAEINKMGRYELCADLLGSVPECDEYK